MTIWQIPRFALKAAWLPAAAARSVFVAPSNILRIVLHDSSLVHPKADGHDSLLFINLRDHSDLVARDMNVQYVLSGRTARAYVCLAVASKGSLQPCKTFTCQDTNTTLEPKDTQGQFR